MKHLLEISRIVTKKKVRKIEIFDDQALKNKSSKFNEFYEALLGGKYKNDRDAATHLYGCSPTDDKYRQLKSRFRKRLLNTLFFLDVNIPSASNYDRAYYSVNKEWTLVKILLSNGAELTAFDYARSILTTSMKYKFADVIVNCCRILRAYTAKHGMHKDFEEYNLLIKEYSNILEAEIRSEELYQSVLINYFLPSEMTQEMKVEMNAFCDALVSLSEQYESPVITYNMFLVWAIRYEILHDYEAMLQVCNKAEEYIEGNETYRRDEMVEIFYFKKMTAYLHLRDYKNGRMEAEKSLLAIKEGSELWFRYMEYYFLLAMHSESFINALAIHEMVTNNNKFRKMGSMEREKWSVYEVYLEYVFQASGNTSMSMQAKKKRSRSAQRNMAEMPSFNKEQRIFVVHYMVAQIMFALDKGNYQEASEKIDRMKSFALRQLKKEDYYRTIQFLRLLQQLAKADFQVEGLSNVEKYYHRLIETPFFYRGVLHELEVLPYEVLWNLILKRLA